MASVTLFDQAKNLANQIRRLLSVIDVQTLPHEQQRLVTVVKRVVEDLRLDVRDYEFASTRSEQKHAMVVAKERFAELQNTILKASEYDLFSASEIATLSAQAEAIADRLQ